MTELRQAPDKPDPRFWDGEARLLMLIRYDIFMSYADGGKNWTPNSRGSRGLRHLGFRTMSTPKNGPVTCPVVAKYGQLLVNACMRLAKELEEGVATHAL